MAEWRFLLCDLDGRQISNLSPILKDVSISFRLNRPSTASFKVRSDNPLVARSHSDGFPRLDSARRTFKALRRERQIDGTWRFVPRFCGYVWTLQDVAEGDIPYTTFQVVDPFHRLTKRFVRDTDGSIPRPGKIKFTDTDGATIAKAIVDRTIAHRGPVGIETSGVFETSTPTRSVEWEEKRVADALLELTGAFNGFDVVFEPVDRTDGILAVMSAVERRGSNREAAVSLGWGLPPRNVSRVERQLDAEKLANDIVGIGSANSGSDAIKSQQTEAGSIAFFGAYEDSDSFNDVTSQEFLDDLTKEEVAFRAKPRELVKVTIASNARSAPRPFLDFNIGDTISLYVSQRLRGGFTGVQRVHGFTLSRDDNGVERVSEIIAAAEEG